MMNVIGMCLVSSSLDSMDCIKYAYAYELDVSSPEAKTRIERKSNEWTGLGERGSVRDVFGEEACVVVLRVCDARETKVADLHHRAQHMAAAFEIRCVAFGTAQDTHKCKCCTFRSHVVFRSRFEGFKSRCNTLAL